MKDLIANWSKVMAGLCAVILTIGYVTGHISSDDFKTLAIGALGIDRLAAGYRSVTTGATDG